MAIVSASSNILPGSSGLSTRVGTLAYMAPEMLSTPRPEDVFLEVIQKGMSESDLPQYAAKVDGMSESDLPQYDAKVDVWSVGVMVFEALAGCQPFLAESPEEMATVQAAKLGQAPRDGDGPTPAFIARQGFSPLATQFVSACLRADPNKRPSARSLAQHPWLSTAAALAARRATPTSACEAQKTSDQSSDDSLYLRALTR
ncbi:hypothetical protein FOA52_005174 [Chlamydomonas sp. UWO 241]|nr:hypothetical protein FOA52_005174 [Chlamydomonas sp. UWO 241]